MPEQRNQYLALLVAFAAGVAVGANWPQIKKKLAPFLKLAGDKMGDFYAQIAQTISEKKERTEDRMAERKYQRATKKTRPKGAAKKASGAPSTEEARFLESLVQMMGQPEAEAPKAPVRKRAAAPKTARAKAAPKATEAGPEPVHEVV